MNALAQALIHLLLSRLHGGQLILIDGEKRSVFGDQTPLSATITVHSPRFYRAFFRGSLGLAEAYLRGDWSCNNLVAVTEIGAANMAPLDTLRRFSLPLVVFMQRRGHSLRRNTIHRSKEQIAQHYDLGNDLFRLFLDKSMMYSCAFFETPETTLHQASIAKLDRICQKLQLQPEDHVMEIGTGWGGFALHAASQYGCKVTTTTISQEQWDHTHAAIKQAGLEDQVTVLLQDYRTLTGQYDKLVSIEMIEAVGWRDFGTFFRRCSQLLKVNGSMLLQAITIEDLAYEAEKASKSFINTYIFPGGCLPSQAIIKKIVAEETDLRPTHLEDLTAHYAETLSRWRANFTAAEAEVTRLGYDRRFRKLWNLYLSYCEGGFRAKRIQTVQLLLAKTGNVS